MPKTPLRAIRVPDDLWRAAQARASERGESVSEVLRRGLVTYVDQPTEITDRVSEARQAAQLETSRG